MKKRMISLLLSTCITFGLLTGCGSTASTTENTEKANTETEQTVAVEAPAQDAQEVDTTQDEAVTEDYGNVKMAFQAFNLMMGGDLIFTNENTSSYEDVMNVLTKLSAAGYEGIEWANIGSPDVFSNIFNLDLAKLKADMDNLGMVTEGIHYHYGWLDTEEHIKQAIDTCKAMGTDKLIFAYSTPATFGFEADEDGNYTVDQIDAWVVEINKVIENCKAAAEGTDIKIIYHNHGTEFQKCSDGSYALDKIECDAKEIDFYWTTRGLASFDTALDYVTNHASEINMLHIKDGLQNSIITDDMSSWGDGTFDLQALIDVARNNPNIEWVVSENDAPKNSGKTGVEDIIDSITYAKENLDLSYTK